MSNQIVIRGPLFAKGGAPVQKAIRDTIQDVVERGEEMVKAQLYPGHGLVTGHYRRSIHGEVRASGNEGRIHDSDVIYGPWLEGVSSRNDRTRFKGYSMFRKSKAALDKAVPRLLQKHIDRAVRELN